MTLLIARRAIQLFRVLTAVPFLGFALLWALLVPAQASPFACQELFADVRPQVIPMLATYRGEEKGLYYDTVLKTHWKVQYFTEKEKRPLELTIKQGLFYHNDGKRADSPFDPEYMHFENALIVIDKYSRVFILKEEERGRFHHSSLSAGEDVIFAGTVAFHNGLIREINNNSGHYKPSAAQTVLAIRELHRMGADLTSLRISGIVAKEIWGSYSMSPKEVQAYFTDIFSTK